ncbi:hypothetical protein ACFW0C_08925 [Aerococcus sp. NPDC058936]|uniref:hypothetical protein n=1 Tax=Aerococcus sp. NPDC058936 TaxID=3346674 RepID=UPI00366EABF7
MFTIDDEVYTLKFNKRKQMIIEKQTGKSLMAEFNQTNGMVSQLTLQAMFTVGLVEEGEDKPVNGQKAIDIYDKVLDNNGYQSLVTATINKFVEDMGFLFR